LVTLGSKTRQHTMATTSSSTNPRLKNTDLYEFFKDGLQDIYWAENHLVKALPKMMKASTSPKLKAGLEKHVKETEEHVSRLDQIFEMLGEKAKAKTCQAMKGLLEEAEEIMTETKSLAPAVRDAAIILASQKVEHYEIATYGGLAALAKQMDTMDVANLMLKTLEEEKQADALLSQVAEQEVNPQAAKS